MNRRIFLLFPVLTSLALSACTPAGSLEALCSVTERDRRDHAAALVKDGGPQSQATGVRVLSKTAAGCGE